MTDLALSWKTLRARKDGARPTVPLRHSLILAAATFLAGLAAPLVHDEFRAHQPLDPGVALVQKPVVPAGDERKAIVADVVATAQKVRALALSAAQSATDPAKKQAELTRAAGCTLTAAQISASEQKDAKQTLDILKNFEQETQGLPPATVEPMPSGTP